MNTREKILDQALKMFNERGIEYVGLRELAAELGIRVGNISYYFPTKDNLVFELSQELSKKNAAVMISNENITLYGFLGILESMYHNQLAYKCLLLSVVHVMRQNKMVAASYKKTYGNRTTAINANLEALHQSGYLVFENEEDKNYLVSMVSLIGRFWISEAAVSFKNMPEARQLKFYLTQLAKTIHPFASAKGRKEIKKFIEELS